MSDWEVIHSYSRAQAIEDGELIDVTDVAQKAGIKYPTVLTRQLYHGYVCPDTALTAMGQSCEGRLMDVLTMLIFSIMQANEKTDEVHFSVSFRMQNRKDESVALWARVDGGDDGKPVITIMLEGED